MTTTIVIGAMRIQSLCSLNKKVREIMPCYLTMILTIVVITGEEDDRTMHQVRGKLFSLEDSQWKERGTGLIRLNVRRSGGSGARLGAGQNLSE
jgi:hypothetical protein